MPTFGALPRHERQTLSVGVAETSSWDSHKIHTFILPCREAPYLRPIHILELIQYLQHSSMSALLKNPSDGFGQHTHLHEGVQPQENGINGDGLPFRLWDLLQRCSTKDADLTYVQSDAQGLIHQKVFTISELEGQAVQNARKIKKLHNARQSEAVLLHFETQIENIVAFWSVVRAGLVPALSTPLTSDTYQRRSHLEHLKAVLQDPLCITSQTMYKQYPELGVLDAQILSEVELSCDGSPQPNNSHSDLNDTNRPAILMLTSGSTANSKVVELTLGQIEASLTGKKARVDADERSVFLNWIGIDHVANLLETHLLALFSCARQIHVLAKNVLADPLLFLRLIDQHRVSHSFAPNFFLGEVLRELTAAMAGRDSAVLALDMSCLRSIVSGGEANVVKTALNLNEHLVQLGAQGPAILAVFGMTETCAGMCYHRITQQDAHQEFAAIGTPIRGTYMRVYSETASMAQRDQIGALHLSGPTIFKTYMNNPTATQESFTLDGWFITGDRAYQDSHGNFHWVGREKEVLNLNGVKVTPQDIENVVERSNIHGAIPSYFAAFPDRGKDVQSEDYCLVCAAHESVTDLEALADAIATSASYLVAARPAWVVPLPVAKLEKSSLGKLSRTKLQALFSKGAFNDFQINTKQPRRAMKAAANPPTTETERSVVKILSDLLDIPEMAISVDQTIFELGVTSLSLFRFEKHLRRSCNYEMEGISLITFLTNPVIRAIATAIDVAGSSNGVYDPVAPLQPLGDKTPLWLVHPASGNTISFLPLARTIRDRPLYALTARGMRPDEEYFASIDDMAGVYYTHMKKAQPQGPYAIMGYSLGTTVAYEIARRLEADGDAVAFCGALDSPPHVIPLLQDLSWWEAATLTCYFLGLIPQSRVSRLTQEFTGLPQRETIERLLDTADPSQRDSLAIDVPQLLEMTNMTDHLADLWRKYEPSGAVMKIDVFYCEALHTVEKDPARWVERLGGWREFSKDGIDFHECNGEHASMLNPENVGKFARILDGVLVTRKI